MISTPQDRNADLMNAATFFAENEFSIMGVMGNFLDSKLQGSERSPRLKSESFPSSNNTVSGSKKRSLELPSFLTRVPGLPMTGKRLKDDPSEFNVPYIRNVDIILYVDKNDVYPLQYVYVE
jgi:hypothetical protein